MYVVDCVKESGSRMNIVLSIVAIVLSAVPAITISYFAVAALLGEGLFATLVTLVLGMVLAVALFALVTSLFRKAGWFK
jgi:ABC-type Na+ efflux pump permease subunit